MLLALAFALLLSVLAGVLFFRMGIAPSGPSAPTPPPAVGTGSAGAPALETPTGAPEEAARVQLENEGVIQIGDEAYKELPRTYSGLGRITGFVEVEGNAPLPETWTLTLEPSAVGLGSQHAGRRTLELPGSQRTFEEIDLPLGAYRVTARADGFDARSQEVVLYRLKDRPEHEAKAHVHLQIIFRPAGPAFGAVVDEHDAPVAEVRVTVESTLDQTRQETLTGPDGQWNLASLREGPYRLYVGAPEAPLVPAVEFMHDSPQKQPLRTKVPELASARISVLDARGTPVPAASIRGHGPAPVQLITEPDGSAVLRNVPPGRYELRVTDPLSELQAKLSVLLALDEPDKYIEISLPHAK